MGPSTTSSPTRATYVAYMLYGTGPDSVPNSRRQSVSSKTAPTAVATTVALPLLPATDFARLGWRLWKASRSAPANSLTARSISAIRRRWSSLAFACWFVVRVIQRTPDGVRISTATRGSTGRDIVAATAAAMNPTDAGSRRSRAVSRKSNKALRLRYSSNRIWIRSCVDIPTALAVFGAFITLVYHHSSFSQIGYFLIAQHDADIRNLIPR